MDSTTWQIYKRFVLTDNWPLVSYQLLMSLSTTGINYFDTKADVVAPEVSFAKFVLGIDEVSESSRAMQDFYLENLGEFKDKVNKFIEIANSRPHISGAFRAISSTQDIERDLDKIEKTLVDLGFVFLESAERDDSELAINFIEAGFPVNFRHPQYMNSLIHDAASYTREELTDFLLSLENCNLLIRDNTGSLPYHLARCVGKSDINYSNIKAHTFKQAAREGADVELIEQLPERFL